MITGVDWYTKQLKEKRKQLARHMELARIYEGKEEEDTFRQLAYDDQRYINLLEFGMENYMRYKDDREPCVGGWCADK